MRRYALAAVFALGLPACDDSAAPAGSARPEASVEQLLYGSAQRCRFGVECAAQVCYRGRCAGLLDVDAMWAQSELLDAVEAASDRDAAKRTALLRELQRAAADTLRSSAERGRALAGWWRLDPEGAEPALEAELSAPKSRGLALRSALLLADLAHPDALEFLKWQLRASTEPVRVLAIEALGRAAVNPEATAGCVEILSEVALDSALPAAQRLAAVRALAPLPTDTTADVRRAVFADVSAPYLQAAWHQ